MEIKEKPKFNPFISLNAKVKEPIVKEEKQEIKEEIAEVIDMENLSLIRREVFCYCNVCKTEQTHKIFQKSVICITCKSSYDLKG